MKNNNEYIAFTGPRSLHSKNTSFVQRVVKSAIKNNKTVVTGCAKGADLYVRQASKNAIVFKASNMTNVPYKARYVTRSIKMVEFVAKNKQGSGVVGFVDSNCPNEIVPTRGWVRGNPPSGTWSTIALAIGLDLPVVLFLFGDVSLPRWNSGEWVRAGNDVWLKGWTWKFNKQLSF